MSETHLHTEILHESSRAHHTPFEAVLVSQFLSKSLQHKILSIWNKHALSFDLPILLSSQARNSLTLWMLSPTLTIGKSYLPYHWNVLTNDASLSGWEGVCFRPSRSIEHGHSWKTSSPSTSWSSEQFGWLCNIVHPLLPGDPIRVQSDIATAVAYINHQGATTSLAALMKASLILLEKKTLSSELCSPHLRSGKLEHGLPQTPPLGSRGIEPLPRPSPKHRK